MSMKFGGAKNRAKLAPLACDYDVCCGAGSSVACVDALLFAGDYSRNAHRAPVEQSRYVEQIKSHQSQQDTC
jgi:hypothetical protein